MGRRKVSRGNSGQALIITALVVSLLIISTFYYVYDVMKTRPENSESFLDYYILMVKLGSAHTVISSLANVTNGGSSQILTINLEAWSSKLKEECPYGCCLLDFQPRNVSPYSSGFYILWGENGSGISSCYVTFNLTIYGRDIQASLKYPVNITTSIAIQGFYSVGNGNLKNVIVICRIFNEGNPALAQSLDLYYQNGSSWIQVENYALTDYGNGTYRIAFNAYTPTTPVHVSVKAYDIRQIYVQANATCNET